MTEKLKYKVGDKVLVEAEVIKVDDSSNPYLVRIPDPVVSNRIWVSANNIIQQPPKPKVTQSVMEYYTQNISADYDYDKWFERNGMPDGIASWLYYDSDDDILMQRQHALATLIAYGPEAVEVEKENRYRVYLVGVKNQWNQRQCLTNNEDNYFFSDRRATDTTYTKQELIDAGFEGVFDNPMFEVEKEELEQMGLSEVFTTKNIFIVEE